MSRALSALLLLSPAVLAASQQDIDSCSALQDNPARLACYDALFAKVQPEALATGKMAVPADTSASLPDLQQTKPDLPDEATVGATPLERQWDLLEDNKTGTFTLRSHNPTYILPVWYLLTPNNRPSTPTQEPISLFGATLKNVETKYQISFKSKLWQNVLETPADLWFGYTQQSHWQMYNKGQSSPFRETYYEPEVLLTMPLPADWQWQGWRLRMAGLGINHQSNGQPDPLSRSWNRLYAMAGVEKGNLSLVGRWWYRLPEKAGEDDNPDIVDFMGRGDLQAIYRWQDHTLGGRMRFNPSTGKGAVQLDWTFPVAGRLRGYVQGFSGYGESLLDYNHYSRGVGFGLMLTDWLAN